MSAPTTLRTSLDETLAHIAAERKVWVRVAAILRDDGKWHARLVELVSGGPASSWKPLVWDYPWALLVATIKTGTVVSEWLRKASATLGDREIVLSKPMEGQSWERRQSRSQGWYEKLDWPVAETTLANVDNMGEPSGPLVSAEDAPSFINLYTAAACFFYLDSQPTGGSLHQGVMYRRQDNRGRISGVRITQDEVVVDVRGNAVGGMVVELAADAPGPSQALTANRGSSAKAVTFPLQSGLPRGAWVLLRRSDEWIDRRYLTGPWGRVPEADVEIVVEPRTRLEAFLASGEGPEVEFKREVPTNDIAKANVMKTVCAFANGQGGSILFGVEDDHTVVGVVPEAVAGLKDQLTHIVGSWLDPQPRVSFEVLPLDDTEVVVQEMRVEPGTELYGSARPTDVPVVYVRRVATTVKAGPREIENIVRGRAPQGFTYRPWGLS